MKLKIEIVMDSAAFEPDNGTEAARILRSLADSIDCNGLSIGSGTSRTLMDINGNTVGKAKVTR